jgi:hypothetical protein
VIESGKPLTHIVEEDHREKIRRSPASHRIASHRIASHRIASHRIASHRIASHRIASHRMMLRIVTLDCEASARNAFSRSWRSWR